MKDNLSYENMDECFRQGISWGCDKECPVYKRGECELQDEVRMSLESETMEEIKLSEYVRNKKGEIFQFVAKENLEINEFMNVGGNRDITKHSPNIIDLIEVGDYVNGYKVSFKGNDYKPFVQCDYPVKQGTTNHYLFYEEAIENIVTKEQFNSIKYVIGE